MSSSIGDVVHQIRAACQALPLAQLNELARRIRDEIRPGVHAAVEDSAGEELHQALGLLETAAQDFETAAGTFSHATELAETYAADVAQAESAIPPQPAMPSPPPPPAPAAPRPVDPAWGARTRASLPPHTGGATVGRYIDASDGVEHPVRSGAEKDGSHHELADHMRANGLVPAFMVNPQASLHVELKVAWWMRTSGTDDVELAINKVVDRLDWGCDRLLPLVLKPGQRLVIHDPEGRKVYTGWEQQP